MLTVKVLGDYIDGRFRRQRGTKEKIVSRDPGDSGYRIGSFPVVPAHADEAVAAARRAQTGWRQLDQTDRAHYLRKFAAEVINRRGELKELIAAETGKPLWEAELDVASVEAQVETEVREGVRAVSPFKVGEIRWGVEGQCRFSPLGVCAVLSPAASPVDLAVSQIVPALLSGNTVIFKPSKLAPACGQFVARLFHEVDLPKGVFNMVQGDAACGLALAADRRVDAVLFIGAARSGGQILMGAAAHPNKLVALLVGGVNPAVVLEDADLKQAVYECIKGAFITSGQRYTSTGIILVEKGVADDFAESFLEKARALRVGYSFDDRSFMGPMLSESALLRALDRQARLEEIGARSLLTAEWLERERPGYYLGPAVAAVAKPQPLDALRPEGQSFGPDVIIVPFAKDKEGLALANSTDHRLAASVFTKDGERFNRWAEGLRFGLVNHNLATTEVSMRLPVTGLGMCGNHRPIGVFAQRNCVSPKSTLATQEPYAISRTVPNYPAD